MSFVEILLTAIGLSMDAFAVSVCKGLSIRNVRISHMLTAGIWFGFFQGLMPALGFYAGELFYTFVSSFSHWIAFVLLSVIGVNMILEAGKEEEALNHSMAPLTMLTLAVATSIDAFAVGTSLALLDTPLFPAVLIIGCTTFLISSAGVLLGGKFGARYQKGSAMAGGIILIAIGLRILLRALFF